MWVKMLKTWGSPEKTARVGEVVDLSTKTAEALIKADAAEKTQAPKRFEKKTDAEKKDDKKAD